ncbi:MAG TPA: lysylphosphatidylglycerol synthase transmembrane domain-containing protein [Bacteroidia bacterium]|nr:lysylphosphatidylglycerol synthase transmembrane domain-containing protein [Bacteroidia bacterium]
MSRKRRKPWLQFFKVAVTLLAVAYVGWKVNEKWDVMLGMWAHPWSAFQWMSFALAIVLMPVNYGLEAQKWRLMVRPFYPGLQLLPATLAVFAGMAAGVFTPNRIGEYAGRILFLKEGKRIEAIMATFVDRICQLFVTLLTGLLALSALWLLADKRLPKQILGDPVSQGVFIFLSIALGAVSFVMLILPRRFAAVIPQRWNRAAWIRKARFALQNLDMQLVGKVVGLAAFRYFIFSSQYVLLMYAFGYEGNLMGAYWMVALIFLGKSVLPVMGILELGAREAVALVVMTAFGTAEAVAIGSTLILYFINLLLPTLLGVVAMQRVKENG